MWLPKNERQLLQGYYVTIGEIGREEEFTSEKLLYFIKSSASPNLPPQGTKEYIEKYKDWLKEWNRVLIAIKLLEERGLIISSHDPDIFIRTYRETGLNSRLTFSLTLKGYDLGRKYNSWFSRTGLWFAEYKDHWFWLLIGFLGGIIGALIVNWLSK